MKQNSASEKSHPTSISRRTFTNQTIAGGLASSLTSFSGMSGLAAAAEKKSAALPFAGKKILVPFSWSFKNIGDIGITPGILHLTETYLPGAHVTILGNSSIDKYEEYLSSRFPNVDLVKAAYRNENSPEDIKKCQQALDDADLVMYNSGTTLSYGRWGFSWQRTMPLAMPLFLARDAGKPYGIYCQSFEMFSPPSDTLFRPLLNNAKFLFTRDTNSLAYLKSLGIQAPNMEFGPDATFGFNLDDRAGGDAIMKQYQLEDRKFITLTIRSPKQGFISAKRGRDHAAKMRQMISDFVEKTGERVLICVEVSLDIEETKASIYDPLPEKIKKNVAFKDTFWTPDEAFSVYKRAKCVVSMEMHSVILALAAGTPSIHPPFVEAGRKAQMVADIGLGEWLFDVDKDSQADMSQALLTIHQDLPAALKKVEKALVFVHQRQQETMAIVGKTLPG